MAHPLCRTLLNLLILRQTLDGRLITVPCCMSNVVSEIKTTEDIPLALAKNAAIVEQSYLTHCRTCIETEKTGYQTSLREAMHEQIPEDAPDGDICVLEIQIDSTCNAECMSCMPESSSLIQKRRNIIAINRTDDHYHTLSKVDLKSIKQIRFFGGEPFLNSQNALLLDLVPDPSSVNLFYSTNGSIFPSQEFTSRWAKFKEVTVSFSLDDIEDRFEYIRRPLKWDKVYRNFIRIATLLSNIKIKIRCTVNALSLWYTPLMQAWVDEVQRKEGFDIDIQWNPAGPREVLFSIWNTPLALRENVKNRLPDDHGIVRMIGWMEDKVLFPSRVLDYFSTCDAAYNLSYEKAFPESLKYFQDLK